MTREPGAEDHTQKWVGTSVQRKEDLRFLTGRGQYVDDIVLPGMLHAAILRSPHAHAHIRGVDASAALALPGVHGVITGNDLVGAIEPAKGRTYPAGGAWYFMATDRVRFFGEPVVMVAAESRYLAEDALEAIRVQYEPIVPVLDPESAADPGVPELHPGAPGGNRVAHEQWSFGDVDAAFGEADVVISERFEVHRYSSTPIECRAVMASFDPAANRVTAWANIGNLNRYIAAARALKIGTAALHLFVPDVGGSFGIKAWVYQMAVLAAVLSRKVGRPVKWVEDRSEHLAASHHAAARIGYIQVASRRDGTLLGVKLRTIDDQGAYVCLNEPFGPTLVVNSGVSGCYTMANVEIDSECVLTNRSPVSANRGYSRVQHFYIVERALDRLAHTLGMDPVQLRRKNLIAPEAFPHTSASGVVYDKSNPAALLDKALELVDYPRARQQQQQARTEGRLLGVGVAMAVEASGPDLRQFADLVGITSNGQLMSDVATAQLNPDGRVVVISPTVPQGQSHETVLAQIAADELGLHPDAVEVSVHFDSASTPYSVISGTYDSRFHSSAAPAVHGAARKLRGQLAVLAARLLEVSEEDIEFVGGQLVVAGSPQRSITLERLARIAHYAPETFGLGTDLALQATYRWNWPSERRQSATFSFLCHAALVEVEAATGRVKVLRYAVAEDIGRVLNPIVATGQTQGGVLHGIGGALFERFTYDETGQLITATLADYLVPRFADAPTLAIEHLEYPTPKGPLGAKSVGEGAAVLPPAVLGNAVEDALKEMGVRINHAHLAPEAVYQAIQRARARGGRG